MQFGLANDANEAHILISILRVQLWEGESLVDAVLAAENGTELALGELFALELLPALPAHGA